VRGARTKSRQRASERASREVRASLKLGLGEALRELQMGERDWQDFFIPLLSSHCVGSQRKGSHTAHSSSLPHLSSASFHHLCTFFPPSQCTTPRPGFSHFVPLLPRENESSRGKQSRDCSEWSKAKEAKPRPCFSLAQVPRLRSRRLKRNLAPPILIPLLSLLLPPSFCEALEVSSS
jgi:hypothetical protein